MYNLIFSPKRVACCLTIGKVLITLMSFYPLNNGFILTVAV